MGRREQLEREVVAIAEEVGALLLEGFAGDAGARTKSKGDLVTEYDERSEALLRERLGALDPSASVVGEEAGGELAERVWFVDPIDGTNNFAHGHPWFCLSLGLVEGGIPTLGVVHAPAMGLTFSARAKGGARKNGAPISTSRVAHVDDALMATGFPKRPFEQAHNNYREFVTLDARSHGVRRCAAAALEIAMVASGAYDGFWDHGLAPWDLAAGVVLVREAGGRVSAVDGSRFDLQAGDVLATNGPLHEPLRDALSHARALPPISQVT